MSDTKYYFYSFMTHYKDNSWGFGNGWNRCVCTGLFPTAYFSVAETERGIIAEKPDLIKSACITNFIEVSEYAYHSNMEHKHE